MECIVVDDGSADGSAAIAEQANCRVLSTPGPRGPAAARNLGAQAAQGDLLLFLDADVLAPPDLVARVLDAFRSEPALDAVIGSYDDAPAHPGFLSQFRNLLHCYVHQTSREQACTFWSGCGAIRRDLFLRLGGFRAHYRRPSIEDIELGARILRSGGRIRLMRDLQVKHLKRWTFWGMLRTDICDRAIPWTLLILRTRRMPADLNLRWRYRLSALLLGGGAAAALVSGTWGRGSAIVGLSLASTIVLNAGFYRFLGSRRGWWFAARAVPLHLLHLLYSAAAFAAGAVLYLCRRRAPAD